ncbi:MAG TPA: hypothetical protein VL400_17325, partial [Polyangiaceae bacterium]|nr:hypothetical protein [Polyangiaceae bacterium]
MSSGTGGHGYGSGPVSFGPTSFPAGSLPVPATIPDEQPRVARAQTMARAGTLMNQFGRGQIG